MELRIAGTHTDISPETRSYIERKLGKLTRYLPTIMDAEVEISEAKTSVPEQRFVAQVTVRTTTNLLRGEERGADAHTAIDKVADVMERQIERYKGKLHKRSKGISLRNEKPAQPRVEHELYGKLVRVKRFAVKPMTVDDAVDQMELLGHDFFLFFDSDTERLKLVYRRKDKDYGLIEPEMG
ncbi:MAG: ribosome-associated translation inhibitor RaiA [Chloroflexi bacterium]|nr:ribosome-associated translation inhibitor RaiA [Chloroflexota bacterium]